MNFNLVHTHTTAFVVNILRVNAMLSKKKSKMRKKLNRYMYLGL